MTEKSLSQLFDEWNNGDHSVLSEIMSLVYDDIHRRAVICMNKERKGHTLQPTALINEIYIRLVSQKFVPLKTKANFLGLISKKMYEFLKDYHEAWASEGRNGHGKIQLCLDDNFDVADPNTQFHIVSPLYLEELLAELATIKNRKKPDEGDLYVDVFNNRYLLGLTLEELVAVHNIPEHKIREIIDYIQTFLAPKLLKNDA